VPIRVERHGGELLFALIDALIGQVDDTEEEGRVTGYSYPRELPVGPLED